jgi:hypothetical protein
VDTVKHSNIGTRVVDTNLVEDHSADSIIKGERLKFPDTRWTDVNGIALPPDNEYLVLRTDIVGQRWIKDGDKRRPEVIFKKSDESLPDTVAQLNAKIPKSKWEKGLGGEARPPWAVLYVVYLVNPVNGKMYTAANSTTGMRIAYRALVDQVLTMRSLRAENVAPIVKLAAKPMKTQYGMKQRPDFDVVEFRSLGGVLPNKPTLQIGNKVGSEKIGEPVEPPTIQEELDDDLPDHVK